MQEHKVQQTALGGLDQVTEVGDNRAPAGDCATAPGWWPLPAIEALRIRCS